MKPLNRVYSIILLLFIQYNIFAQGALTTVAPTIKTFAMDAGLSGAATGSVNLFSGDVALPLSLISLPGHNGLDVNVSISYSSNVQNIVGSWNLDAPTGILGLGWDMNIPKIVCDHKQTGTREDDDFYLIEGGSPNKLIFIGASGGYENYAVKNYQLWQIKYDNANELWQITKQNGTIYKYGDANSVNASGGKRKTVQYSVRWGNWIGNSGLAKVNSVAYQSQIATAWNLSEINNVWKEKIIFEYLNTENYMGDGNYGKLQTEASYIKKITDVYGRAVVFNYLDKSTFKPNNVTSQFYIEPHTEKAEPDGYQEFYEKNYLDRIDVLDEAGSVFLNVQLGYTVLDGGTNMAKMLLASITQKNKNGNSLPGLQFNYKQSGNTKGFLEKITYPSGGSTIYNYNDQGVVLGHSNKQLTISVPQGLYGEPQVYVSDEDYVVVFWRELNTNSTHDKNKRGIVMKIYQWVGEWVESSPSIGQYGITLDENFLYQHFQVEMKKDFFAILGQSYNNPDYYKLNIIYKSDFYRGGWVSYSPPQDIYRKGAADPDLLAGDNFIAVGVEGEDLYTYTFIGNNWRQDLKTQPPGSYFYSGTNNFITSHNRFGGNTDILYFNYLSKGRDWVTGINMSPIFKSAGDNSYWHASNSFVVGMINNNPEYIYGWDADFSSLSSPGKFIRYDNVWGALADEAPVFSINNSSFAYSHQNPESIDFKVARFNGVYWDVTSGTGEYTSLSGITFGDDYLVYYNNKTLPLGDSYYNYDCNLIEYNAYPNANPWKSNSSFFTKLSNIIPDAKAGINTLAAKNLIFSKQTDGNWKTIGSYGTADIHKLRMSAPHFYTFVNEPANLYSFPYIQLVKNGELFGNKISITNRTSQDRGGSYTVFNANAVNLSSIIKL